jgi:hypothetical protein
MREWSTGSGGASGPRATEAGRVLARVVSRVLARLSGLILESQAHSQPMHGLADKTTL